ncbi:Hypothetical protein CINCED_3A009242 [Cinara cedri]|uniref:Uncharacterized protein n=1 Tax=Cinara cedri TaxID=506608 RepID=A0A5E4M3B4_9HEMI|nr:Hypothetical protein CINCED_3A009242 [Cinara cedri]
MKKKKKQSDFSGFVKLMLNVRHPTPAAVAAIDMRYLPQNHLEWINEFRGRLRVVVSGTTEMAASAVVLPATDVSAIIAGAAVVVDFVVVERQTDDVGELTASGGSGGYCYFCRSGA